MKLKRAFLAAVAAAAVSVSLAGTAQASTGEENQMSPEACGKSQSASKFKFAIYYNSKYAGSYRNVGYNVYNFADERIGGAAQGGTQPLRFCRSGAGKGQGIKNNAASAINKHSSYNAVVYYNSGYKGARDTLFYKSNLSNTYNNNASFAWRTA